MSKKRRIAALTLAILFVAFAALSLTFMIAEAGHDCSGDDCPVCEQIAYLSGILRAVTVVLSIILLSVIAVSGAGKIRDIVRSDLRAVTPVLLKIKLTD